MYPYPCISVEPICFSDKCGTVVSHDKKDDLLTRLDQSQNRTLLAHSIRTTSHRYTPFYNTYEYDAPYCTVLYCTVLPHSDWIVTYHIISSHRIVSYHIDIAIAIAIAPSVYVSVIHTSTNYSSFSSNTNTSFDSFHHDVALLTSIIGTLLVPCTISY